MTACRRGEAQQGSLAGLTVEMFGDPCLDDGLASDAEPGCLGIQGRDHPCREVDVHALGIASGSTDCVKIEVLNDVGGVLVEHSVEFSSLDAAPPQMVVLDGPR